jgi:hypothetical protein
MAAPNFWSMARTNAGVAFRDLEDDLFRFDSVAVSKRGEQGGNSGAINAAGGDADKQAGVVTVHLAAASPPFHEQAFELVNQAHIPGGFNEIHRRRNPAVLKQGFAIKRPSP